MIQIAELVQKWLFVVYIAISLIYFFAGQYAKMFYWVGITTVSIAALFLK